MPTTPTPMMAKETSDTLRSLVKKDELGAGVFKTANGQQTCEELKAKGVEFVQPPTERFYGIEALLKENSGNWFSMTESKEAYEVPSQ